MSGAAVIAAQVAREKMLQEKTNDEIEEYLKVVDNLDELVGQGIHLHKWRIDSNGDLPEYARNVIDVMRGRFGEYKRPTETNQSYVRRFVKNATTHKRGKQLIFAYRTLGLVFEPTEEMIKDEPIKHTFFRPDFTRMDPIEEPTKLVTHTHLLSLVEYLQEGEADKLRRIDKPNFIMYI